MKFFPLLVSARFKADTIGRITNAALEHLAVRAATRCFAGAVGVTVSGGGQRTNRRPTSGSA